MLRINIRKNTYKHKVLYTSWELHDVTIKFRCVQELMFLRIINLKHLELSNKYRVSQKRGKRLK